MKSALTSICCFSTEFCKGSCIGLVRNQNIKLSYSLLIIISYMMSTFIGLMVSQSSSTIQDFNCEFRLNVSKCVIQETQKRVMFCLFIIFIILFGCMFLRSQKAKIVNEGLWLIKLIFLGLLCLLFTLIPFGPLLRFVSQITSYISVVYYFFQSVVIIDGLYAFNGWLNQSSDQSPRKALVVLKTLISLSISVASISVNIWSYYKVQSFFCIINSILMGIFLIVVFLRYVKTNNLFIWGSIMLYINLMTITLGVNSTYLQQTIFYLSLYQYFICIVFLLGIIGQGSSQLRTKKSTINQALSLNTNRQQDSSRYIASNKWIIYHFVMAIIIISLPHVLNLQPKSSIGNYHGVVVISQIIGVVIAYLLYIWSIISSKIYSEKDFSQLQNYFKEFELN